jgi:hypothetical protein
MTPYNTGKVKIGLAYTAPAHYEMSKDMSRLQESLLREPDSSAGLVYFIGVALCLIAAILMI